MIASAFFPLIIPGIERAQPTGSSKPVAAAMVIGAVLLGALATGLIEPLGGLVGVAIVQLSTAALPWALGVLGRRNAVRRDGRYHTPGQPPDRARLCHTCADGGPCGDDVPRRFAKPTPHGHETPAIGRRWGCLWIPRKFGRLPEPRC